MTDHDRLDDLLMESLADLPPEDIVEGVTPWRKAMKRVLWGLGLTMVTLNFLYLQYLLPALGITLCLLGFRTLRRENGWLRACFGLTAGRTAIIWLQLVLYSTIRRPAGLQAFVAHGSAFLAAAILFCLWRGLRALRQKAGLEPGARPALALLVWYLFLFLLALARYQGPVLLVGMLVCYGFILRSLHRLSGAMEQAGYALCPAPVRISDGLLSLLLVAVLAAGLALGYRFGGQHPMDWQVREEEQLQEVEDIKAHLLALDFPVQVLEDLSDEDILQCKGALKLYTTVEDHAMNPGRVVNEYRDGVYHQTTIHDVEELRVTGVAVLLPGEQETWKLIHHFHWREEPGLWGTEAIRLRPEWRNSTWGPVREITGRVLMDREGVTYTAPYWSLAAQTYTASGMFFGPTTDTSTIAAFSFPKQADDRRGYLTFTMEKWGDRSLLSSWFDYAHQQSRAQYPAQSAEEHFRSRIWGTPIFCRVQDAIQFQYYEGKIS